MMKSAQTFPRITALKRAVNRAQVAKHPHTPTSFSNILQQLPPRYSQWLLKDTGNERPKHRQSIFCPTDGLKELQMATHWICDGMFKIAPRFACELYTVHTQPSSESAFAHAVSLMARKMKRAYKNFFCVLHNALPDKHLGPQFISTDFEEGGIAAYQTIFPCASPAGSLFHLRKQCTGGCKQVVPRHSITRQNLPQSMMTSTRSSHWHFFQYKI